MNRITKKMVFKWIDEWNELSVLKIKITIYSGFYHFEDAKTGEMLVVGQSAGKVWENWEIFRKGYFIGCDHYADYIN